ncbi:class I SAM-dependent methyltransferase [Pirellulaceae bacterium]|nr:class I SAM-dependent methyltransferase [Pirellulaceae bacterium]
MAEKHALIKGEKKNYSEMDGIVKDIKNRTKDDAVVIELGGSVYQARSGNAYNEFKNYFPLDISSSSMQRYSEKFGRESIICDAQCLPFADESVDVIFTHTFLEHPINPDFVLKEVDRVLKKGGLVIHNDAWFVRWWQRFGIVGLKPFWNCGLKEKMIQIAARITELKIVRLPPVILRRLFRMIFASRERLDLRFRQLQPNYDLHLYCDEDAASSIDPIDVICFYESRSYHTLSRLSFFQRLFHGNRYVAMQKKE